MQEPPSLRHDPEDAEMELHQRFLQMRLDELNQESALPSRMLEDFCVRHSNCQYKL